METRVKLLNHTSVLVVVMLALNVSRRSIRANPIEDLRSRYDLSAYNGVDNKFHDELFKEHRAMAALNEVKNTVGISAENEKKITEAASDSNVETTGTSMGPTTQETATAATESTTQKGNEESADMNGAVNATLFLSADMEPLHMPDTESIKHNSLHRPDDNASLNVELLEATMHPDYDAGSSADDDGLEAGAITGIVALVSIILAGVAYFLNCAEKICSSIE